MKAVEPSDEDQVKVYNDSLKETKNIDEPAARGATPSQAQLDYYKDELSAFIHFGPNTFTGNEWGHGTPEEIKAFNPTELDTDQWVTALKKAGFKKVIVTAKHHDGFQLWPSEYSERNVKNSPFGLASEDQGDILARLSASCSKIGLDMGLYLSPWDMGDPSYGEHVKVYNDRGEVVLEVNADGSVAYFKEGTNLNSEFYGRVDVVKEDNDGNSLDPNGDYNELYINQLKEVLTNDKYGRDGRFKEVWMDGAKNDPRYQQYDLKEWWQLCRELEPDVLIFNNIGNDVRWVGNESGFSYDPIWPQVSSDKMWNDYNLGINSRPTAEYPSKLKIVDNGGVKRWAYANSYEDGGYLTSGDPNGNIWSMPEADYSIIGDWFWKNKAPQSGKDMTENYFQSVGNATPMLLNTPPNQKGLLEDSYIESMNEFRDILDRTFTTNVVTGATATATSTYKDSPTYSAQNVTDNEYDTYWSAEDGKTTGELTVFLNETKQFDLIDIKEYIPLGQNISSYEVDVRVNGKWQSFGRTSGTRKNKKTIGYQSMLRDKTVNADAIRLKVNGSYGSPKISGISAYKMDSRIEFSRGTDVIPEGLSFVDAHSAITKGNWDKTDENTARENSMFSKDTTATAKYTFTGSRFFLSSRYSPEFGGVKITIDDQEPVIVNLNDSTEKISSIVYKSGTLVNGLHKVTLQPVEMNKKVGMSTDGLYYLNNDNVGMFEIENPEILVDESKTSTLIVNRLGGSNGPACVRVSTSPGTAVHGRHYESVNEVIEFGNGETRKEVSLPTIDNEETTGTLYYTVALSEAVNAILGFDKKATISIEDNEIDTSKLTAAIEEAKKKNQSYYTEKMWTRLQNLITDAEVFISKDGIKQSQIDAYLKNFTLAINDILKIGTYAELSATDDVLFEAEDGTLNNGSNFYSKDEHPNFAGLSGRGMVGDIAGNGSLTITLDAPYAGTYRMDIQVYSGGPDLLYYTNNETGDNAIEGSKQIPFNGGGGTVKKVSVDLKLLNPGINKITFVQKKGGANHPNMDSITFAYQYVAATGVSISPQEAEIKVGDSLQMSSEVTPSDASNKDLAWTSEHNDIASVDANGNVTALESGKVTITASSSDGPSATVNIIILPNTKLLEEKFSEAKAIHEAGYTKDSFAKLSSVINKVKDALKDRYVKQSLVNEMLVELTNAIDNLVVKADKIVLKDTIDTAEKEEVKLPATINKAVKVNFLTALENARVVMDAEDTDMISINQANAKLSTTIQMLSFLSDYAVLDNEINIANEIQKHFDQYEETGKDEFLAALANATQVRNNIMSIDVDIIAASNRLQDAIKQLKPIESSGSIQRDILESAVNKAIDIKKNNLLDGLADKVVAYFNASLDQGVAVLANENATVDDIMKAWLELADAMHFLDFKADKTLLNNLIIECKAIDLKLYQEAGKADFKTALGKAIAVYENPNVLQPTINSVYDELLTAKNNLKLITTDLNKVILQYMISEAENAIANADYYEHDGNWNTFLTALDAAKAANDSAETQLDINQAIFALADAYENIRLIANEDRLSELRSFIELASRMNIKGEVEVAYVNEAIAFAESLIEKGSYTQKEFLQFKDMQSTIERFKENVDTVQNEMPEKPINKEEVQANNAGGNPLEKPIAKTGDVTSTGMISSLVLASGAVLFALRRNKRKGIK